MCMCAARAMLGKARAPGPDGKEAPLSVLFLLLTGLQILFYLLEYFTVKVKYSFDRAEFSLTSGTYNKSCIS